jgi:hypothetical protein
MKKKMKQPDDYDAFVKRITKSSLVELETGTSFQNILMNVMYSTIRWQEEWKKYNEENK